VNIKKPKEEVVIIPETKKIEKPQVKEIKFATPVIVSHPSPEEMMPEASETEDAKIGFKNIAGTIDDHITGPVGDTKGIVIPPQRKEANRDSVFLKVEIESEYPGGTSAWQRFLNKKLANNYPQEAIDKHVDGKVVV